MKKSALTLCLVCVLLLGLPSIQASAMQVFVKTLLSEEQRHGDLVVRTDNPASYTLTPESEGSEIFDLVIQSGAHVTLSGNGSKFNIFVAENAQDVVITLDGFSTDRPAEGAWGRRNGIALRTGSSAAITLVGDNSIRAGWESCAIQVSESAALTVDGAGTLNASINNGSNAAYCAVIGGTYGLSCGNITVNGGTINARSTSSSAAAIGTALWQGNEGACGIVAGYGNGNFGPEDAITREQLAAILYRYSGAPASAGTLTGFTDADKASGYALDALRWAVEQGIIQGKGNGILDPGGSATRAEIAAMLQRFFEDE